VDQKTRNREQMPTVASMIDELRAQLGPEFSKDLRLLYASEGGHVIGRPSASQGVIPCVGVPTENPKIKK
jgi:hypothetical protein